MSKKSSRMREIEEQHHEPLETLIPALINRDGFTETCGSLGITKAGLSYWLLKLGIKYQKIALAPNEYVQIRERRTTNMGG